jgi:hypothetical protein
MAFYHGHTQTTYIFSKLNSDQKESTIQSNSNNNYENTSQEVVCEVKKLRIFYYSLMKSPNSFHSNKDNL